MFTIFMVLFFTSCGSSIHSSLVTLSDAAPVNVIQFGAIGDGKTDDSQVNSIISYGLLVIVVGVMYQSIMFK